jgi:hypothetical protein
MRVALVNMPFGSLQRPSIGISLLKAKINQIGFECNNYYLNLRFPLFVGLETYLHISDAPPTPLVGEWVFSQAAFETTDDTYLQMLESKFINKGRLSLSTESLLDARSKVEDYLQDCLTHVDWESYDVIGFTTSFEQNVASLALASRIKETWPNKKIIFGGANCEGEMGITLLKSFDYIDAICQGEGDLSFPNYVSYLHHRKTPDNIPGIITRHSIHSYNIGD